MRFMLNFNWSIFTIKKFLKISSYYQKYFMSGNMIRLIILISYALLYIYLDMKIYMKACVKIKKINLIN